MVASTGNLKRNGKCPGWGPCTLGMWNRETIVGLLLLCLLFWGAQASKERVSLILSAFFSSFVCFCHIDVSVVFSSFAHFCGENVHSACISLCVYLCVCVLKGRLTLVFYLDAMGCLCFRVSIRTVD